MDWHSVSSSSQPSARGLGRGFETDKKTGLEIIRTWLYWSKVNPHPDVWDFEEYRTLLDLALSKNLRVVIQLMPEASPYWFEEMHPDARYHDEKDHPISLAAKSSQSVGGSPGICHHNPLAKEAVKEFIQRSATEFENHPALYAWGISCHSDDVHEILLMLDATRSSAQERVVRGLLAFLGESPIVVCPQRSFSPRVRSSHQQVQK